MARSRLNRGIEALASGGVAFAAAPIPANSGESIASAGRIGHELIVLDMEHQWFDISALQRTLEQLGLADLHDRRPDRLPKATPIVRLPTNAREQSEWIIKLVLDAGAFGIVVPQMDTVESARAAVAACRYAREFDAPDHPGRRGYWPRLAPRRWDMDPDEYMSRAELWPLDPSGELLLIPIIETVEGVRNLPAILSDVAGIGAIWAGTGDLSVSLRAERRRQEMSVEEALGQILATCQAHDVPCGIAVDETNVLFRIEQGYRVLFSEPSWTDNAMTLGNARERRTHGS